MKHGSTTLRTCTAWRGGSECLACDGRENALFSGLPEDVLETLHVDVNNNALPAGGVLYEQGQAANHLWVLRSGPVKLVTTSWDGERRIVRVLKAGDIAGMEGLLAGRFSHTAVAVGGVRACRTPLAAVRQLCLDHAGFQWKLMQQWQAALHETEQWLVDATTTGATARMRMARLLLRLRDGDSERIFIFSREDLGLMLGIAIETASRIIAGFVREQLLIRKYAANANPSRYYLGDIPRLEQVAAHGG